VYENTGDDDKMSSELPALYTKRRQLQHNQPGSSEFLGRKFSDSAITRGEPALYQCIWKGSAGGTANRDFKYNYVQSRNVYENKQIPDKMPEKSRTFMSKIRTFSTK
jgi:hypothetical protein